MARPFAITGAQDERYFSPLHAITDTAHGSL
jgi:hypothetical protein